ncbi:hypothetical protein F4818DRAFT_422797 [Hypoxylon cercidicola]|nr:hypothetical protein F4818DRAFT_422797 [Hypoxylon cercidicola]
MACRAIVLAVLGTCIGTYTVRSIFIFGSNGPFPALTVSLSCPFTAWVPSCHRGIAQDWPQGSRQCTSCLDESHRIRSAPCLGTLQRAPFYYIVGCYHSTARNLVAMR